VSFAPFPFGLSFLDWVKIMVEAARAPLKHRALKAGWWTLASYIINLVIRFGSNLILTRLLAPEMFGVMTIATIIMIGLAMFSDLGIKQNIVQSARGHDPYFLNTAWTIQILRGVLLWVCAVGVSAFVFLANRAGLVAPDSVYAADSLPAVISISALTAVIAGFESTKLFEASRGLSLGLVTAIEIVAQVVGLICMIGWVLVDRSIWVLVAGGLGSSLARTALSHTLLPGVSNRLTWDRSASHELVHYGKWIFLSSVLGFLVNSGDRLLLGGLVSSTILGLYSIASLIPVSIDVILNKVMADVTFPAFSEIVRERRHDLKQTYYRFFQIIAPISYFLAGFLLTSGVSLIHILYDARYQQAGWMLELQSVILLTIPSRLGVQSYLALGMPKLTSHVILGRLIVVYIAIPIAFKAFGMEGAVAAIVLSQFVSLPVIYFYNVKYGLFDLRRELQMIVFVLFGLIFGKIFDLTTYQLMGR
jgi:O-antigen/teichoic acid export membrane protein